MDEQDSSKHYSDLDTDLKEVQVELDGMRYLQNEMNLMVEELRQTTDRIEQENVMHNHKICATTVQQHLQQLNNNINTIYQSIIIARNKVYQIFIKTTQTVSKILTILEGYLMQYKRQQKLAQIGAQFEKNSKDFDPWFHQLFRCLRQRSQQLVNIQQLMLRMQRDNSTLGVLNLETDAYDGTTHERISTVCRQQFIAVIDLSIVIVQQPPCIIMMTKTPASDYRKGARPPCSPELKIMGAENLDLQNPTVKCYLMEHDEALQLKDGTTSVDNVYRQASKRLELKNNDATFDAAQDVGLVAKFHRMVVPKRAETNDKGGKDKVPSRKYYFAFAISLDAFGLGQLNIAKLSLPVALLSHPKQEKEQGGDAHIFWQLAFSAEDGILQPDPESVPVVDVVQALDYKFVQYTGATRHLHPAAFEHLANKLLKIGNINEGTVTKEAFFNCPLNPPGSEDQFTFREWFYSVMDMIKTRDGLIHQWNAGLIYGFMDRQSVEIALGEQEQLTLIVKFSDSRRELLISYGCKGQGVQHVLPLSDDLPSIGPIPLEHVVKTTTQLQNVHWVYGPDHYTQPLAQLWIVPEEIRQQQQLQQQHRQKKNSGTDPNRPNDPGYYRMLKLQPQIVEEHGLTYGGMAYGRMGFGGIGMAYGGEAMEMQSDISLDEIITYINETDDQSVNSPSQEINQFNMNLMNMSMNE